MSMKSFLRNTSGNIAVMFSLAAVPLLIGAGAAVDMVRANNANSLLQAASDGAALAGGAGKNAGLSDAAVKKLVKDYLKTNGTEDILSSIKVNESGFNKATGVFHVKITGTVKTTFMALAGIPSIDAIGYSEVELGSGGLELALVLDTTGSMNAEGRLPALKTAAKDLVEKILKDKEPSAYIKVGIVPFANYVNVGVSNAGKSWVDVPPMIDTYSCWNSYPSVTYSNCRQVPNLPLDGVPQPGTHEECDANYGPPVEVCGWYKPEWYGTVGSRNSGLDTKTKGGGAAYPGLLNYNGPQAITELTDNLATLKTNIDALSASEETYIPAGLVWGWELLDASEPFLGAKTAAEMASSKGTKALVLMTDGDNTKSADAPYNWGSDSDAADAKTKELCVNIKKEGISVYTVAFKVGKASSKKMLKDCASAASQAFDAADDDALIAAFGDIAASLAQIRLTK